MKLIQLALVIMSILAFVCGSAPAQTIFNEVEPNSTKAEATHVVNMRSGDKLAGSSTGSDATPGSNLLTTADMFLIKTAPRVPGIYGYLLYQTGNGHVATLHGLDQTGTPGSGGVAGTNDVTLQTTQQIVADFVVWYGFGKEEQVYARIHGNGGNIYQWTLGVSPQFIRWVDNTFQPGPITISTVGLTNVDTDLVLLDGNFDPVPGGTNDDEFPVASKQSRITRTLSAGTYYIGVAPADIASSIVAPNDEGHPTGRLLDFPSAIATTGNTGAGYNFSVSDGTTTSFNGYDQPFAFTISWFRFTVGEAAATPFCFGDGSSLVCPCGPGAAGHGCPNSANLQGGLLQATGTASLAADDATFVTSGLPSTATALFFQSDDYFWATVADGIICASKGDLIRLGVTTSQNGNAQFPPSDDIDLSALGLISSAGSSRYYQVAYRDPPDFCNAAPYNYTNAMRIVWAP